MTHKTPIGDRILVGAERKLFSAALGMMIDLLSDSPVGLDCGIPVFDDLQHNQQLAAYLDIGRSLLDESVAVTSLTAVRDAAIASVYQFIEDMVESEIVEASTAEPEDDFEVASWRTLLSQAAREHLELDGVPRADSCDLEEWKLIVQCLADRVLWDSDWALSNAMDIDVEQRVQFAEITGVDPNYFVWVPPDPLDTEVPDLIRQLQCLTPNGRDLPPLWSAGQRCD